MPPDAKAELLDVCVAGGTGKVLMVTGQADRKRDSLFKGQLHKKVDMISVCVFHLVEGI